MGDARLWQWLDNGGWLINYVWLRERERERERERVMKYPTTVTMYIYTFTITTVHTQLL